MRHAKIFKWFFSDNYHNEPKDQTSWCFYLPLSKKSREETLVFKLIFLEGENKFEEYLGTVNLIVVEPVT